MGTIYRTLCGHVASPPEPTSAEFISLKAYINEHGWWARAWDRVATDHERACPQAR